MKKNRLILLAFAAGLLLLVAVLPVQAAILEFNSETYAGSAAKRLEWLNAIGIATPEYLVDFETDFTDGQNVSGQTGLFPGGLVITDTSAAHQATIRSSSAYFGGSNPVGTYALAHNELAYLELDFSARPVDYVAFRDIDQAGTTVVVTFVGGSTVKSSFETTATSGNSAEFYGIFRNDQPRIVKVQLDASGDGEWGIDNIEYGVKAVPRVPEPFTMILLGTGLAGLGVMRRRTR